MNAQDVTRETYDSANKAVKVNIVAGGSSASGNVTLNPSSNFIGIVTVANPGTTSGNVTLNPSPNYIGLVSVSGNVGFAGNITLDPGSKTQIIGNLTLSDSKGYIGLVSVSQSAWSDPKTFIGLTTSTISNATLFAVVNTGAVDNTNALATLLAGPNYVGLVTADIGTIKAWSDPKTFLGLTTSVIGSAPTIFAVVNTTASGGGNVTLDAGSKTQIVGNLTISDSKGFIGLVSVSGFANPLPVTGSFYQATQPVSFSNVTISDSKGFIGLVSVSGTVGVSSIPSIYGKVATLGNTAGDGTGNWRYLLIDDDGHLQVDMANAGSLNAGTATIGIVRMGSLVTLAASPNYIGLASINIGAGAAYIGLVSVSGSVGFSGNITLDAGSFTGIKGNLTLSDAKGFIGLTTSVIGNAPILGASTNYIGLVTTTLAAVDTKSFLGLVTASNGLAWGDPKTYIGLVTATSVAWADPKGYIGLVTITGSLAAAAGNVTLDDGSLTGLVAGSSYIGLATAVIGNAPILGASTNYIGLVTTTIAAVDTKSFLGLVTVAPHALTIGTAKIGLVTLSASDAWVGLVTATIGNAPILGASTNYIGLVTATLAAVNTNAFLGLVTVAPHSLTVGTANIGLVTLNASAAWIGLVTTSNGLAWTDPKTWIGLVTADIAHAWVDPTTFIGLATVVLGGGGTKYIGLTTTTLGVGTSNIGLVTATLAAVDTKSYLGLVTSVNGAGTQFIGLVTVGNNVRGSLGANVTIGSFQVGVTTRTQIIASDTTRRSLTLRNLTNGVAYIGMNSLVSTSNGMFLNYNDALTLDNYYGAVFGTANATCDIRFVAELD